MTSSFVSRPHMNYYTAFILILTFLFCIPTILIAEEDTTGVPNATDELEEELKYLKAETFVITASRILENIKKAPASISVVTAKEIRQMGARNLIDVLHTVTGYDYKYGIFGQYNFLSRGIFSAMGEKYLLMVNSHPLDEAFTGGAIEVHGTMTLDNVERIEFIRGPGSALYGANAYAGVINIITKEASDIDGVELTARGGSYDTRQYNILFGKDFNGLETVFNFNYLNTDGYEGFVKSDAQAFFDQLHGTNVSETPGRMNTDEKKYDAALTLKYKGIRFDGKYVDKASGMPLLSYMVTDKSKVNYKDYYLTLSYEKTLWKGLDLFTKIYRNHHENQPIVLSVPEGAYRPWLGIAPKDLYQAGNLKSNATGFEIQMNYKISDTNTAVAGITYEETEMYDVELHSNFLPTGVIFPSVQNNTDAWIHNRAPKRNFKAVFFEDIWDFTDNLRLTAGARYDYYSDFGGHFSPRVGLTWEFIKGYDLKLLYGHAFRAPSFGELYDTTYGNPDLNAETVDTYELSLGAELTPSLSGRFTLYRNDMRDGIQIRVVGGDIVHYANLEDVKAEGFEIEFKYDFRRGNYLAMNYNYQTADILHDDRRYIVSSPTHIGNIMANVRLNKYLNFNTYCHFREGYKRQIDDPREDMSGHVIFNATLIAKKFLKGFEGLELRASVYNLFDKDYALPAASFMVPDDNPRPGRNFMLGIRYTF